MFRFLSLLAMALALPGCNKPPGGPDPVSSFVYGQQSLANGSYDTAISWFTSDIDQNPNHAEAYKFRAKAHYLKGETMPPPPTEGHGASRTLDSPVKEFESTIADATKAVELASKDPEAYIVRAKAYHRLGGEHEKKLAVEDCMKAKTLASDGPMMDQATKLLEEIRGQ
jgi:tetratricopeptide (TPR) repeat protein